MRAEPAQPRVRSALALTGAVLVGFWVIAALAAPLLPLFDPNAFIAPLRPPLASGPDGGMLWLGTDQKGRDVLSRVLFGARPVLLWAGLATLAAHIVGAAMGLIAGYRGGWWDEAMSFLCNVFLSFPVIVLYVVVIAYLGAGGPNIVIAVTVASAPVVMRLVRGLVVGMKNQGYVRAAETRGETTAYILIAELLINLRGPLLADACLRFGYSTMAIAVLGYLGLGLPPPDPDWGRMIAEAQPLGRFAAHSMLVPAAAISSLVLGFSLLADGLQRRSTARGAK